MDYSIKDISYKEQRERIGIISDGIRFGELGKQKSEEVIAMSLALMTSFMNQGDYDTDAIKKEVYSQFMEISADDIAEYLGSTKMLQKLLPTAIDFEGYAYRRDFLNPLAMAPEAQSIIGLLCDFFSLDRKKVLV